MLARIDRELVRSFMEGLDDVGMRVRFRHGKPVTYLWQAFSTFRLRAPQAVVLAADLLEMLADTRFRIPRKELRTIQRAVKRLRKPVPKE